MHQQKSIEVQALGNYIGQKINDEIKDPLFNYLQEQKQKRLLETIAPGSQKIKIGNQMYAVDEKGEVLIGIEENAEEMIIPNQKKSALQRHGFFKAKENPAMYQHEKQTHQNRQDVAEMMEGSWTDGAEGMFGEMVQAETLTQKAARGFIQGISSIEQPVINTVLNPEFLDAVGNILSIVSIPFPEVKPLALGAKGTALARRTYLNEKFSRTGDLDIDISYRGYLEKVSKLDIFTEMNGAIFYSGNRGLNRAQALNYAKQTGGKIIDFTPGGKYLLNENLRVRFSDYDNLSSNIWKDLSARYARQARGEVSSFVFDADINRVYHQVELPILKANSNVTQIVNRTELDLNAYYLKEYEMMIERQYMKY